MKTLSEVRAEAGKKGGQITSTAKVRSSRKNGKLGGRPKKGAGA